MLPEERAIRLRELNTAYAYTLSTLDEPVLRRRTPKPLGGVILTAFEQPCAINRVLQLRFQASR
jgi:hypothetical protein